MQSLEAQSTAVAILAGRITFRSRLHLPPSPKGLVRFVQGGMNCRDSLRNQVMAASWFREPLRDDADIAA